MQTQGESNTEVGGNPWMACLHLTHDTGDNSSRLLETDRTRDVHLLEKPSHAEKWTFLLETPGKYSITKVTCIQRRQVEIIHEGCLLSSVSSHSINNSQLPKTQMAWDNTRNLCVTALKNVYCGLPTGDTPLLSSNSRHSGSAYCAQKNPCWNSILLADNNRQILSVELETCCWALCVCFDGHPGKQVLREVKEKHPADFDHRGPRACHCTYGNPARPEPSD